MKFLLVMVLGAMLVVLCWPVAVLLLIALPFLWLLSIPFQIGGAVLEGVVALLCAVFTLPARLLR